TVYPGMWRVRSPDGRHTDMANLTPAKDAAVCIALEILKAGKRGRQNPLGAAPVRSNRVPCPQGAMSDLLLPRRARGRPSPDAEEKARRLRVEVERLELGGKA